MHKPDMTFEHGLPSVSQVADYLDYYASQKPDSPALIFESFEISYRELAAHVDECARGLLGAGVGHGDIVATLSNPRPEFVITFLATVKIGAIWLGLNPKYTIDELSYVVEDARPRLVFSVGTRGERDFAGELRSIADKTGTECEVLDVRAAPGGLAEALANHARCCPVDGLERAAAGVSPKDPALIVYTSGTTGKPKGAMLPQVGLARCARIQHRYWGALEGRTRIINPFPINHLACVGDVWCLVLASGGAMVLMEHFDTSAYLRFVDRHEITVIGLIPTMYLMLRDNPAWNETTFDSVQRMVWGGAAAPHDLIRELANVTPHLSGAYGSTETVGQVCFVPGGATLEQLADTIGPPVPEYEVRIATEDGTPVTRGSEGEIQVRGEFVFLGYLNRPEATAEAFTEDGWLKTGDAAVERPDGFYRITGRLKEMFKSGGYNVYPREIEICLENHADVELAAVIGVPDPLYDEVGEAFCQLRPGATVSAEALEQHCRHHLANYKVPKRIHLTRSLPMLPVGKVDKARLKSSTGTAS